MSDIHTVADCDEHHDVVRDFDDEGTTLENPTITVLCGSTRFAQTFREQNLNLTLAGHIVLSIGCDMRSDAELFVGIDADGLAEIKAQLDWLHRRKIDLADEVLVLNVSGYVGDSTRSEIEYAEKIGKPVRYLEAIR